MEKSSNPGITAEIRMQRLDKHLREVERIIREWISQLRAPDPFKYYPPDWRWQSVYRPPLERDDDSNHMLRRHQASRTLWTHHTDWERRLNKIWGLLGPIHREAQKKMEELGKKSGDREMASAVREYTEHYLSTALWQAFRLCCGERPNQWYRPGDMGKGVNFGSWPIESSCSTEGYQATWTEHRHLVYELQDVKELHEAAEHWQEVQKLEGKMANIAGPALKKSAFLNATCQFCKDLRGLEKKRAPRAKRESPPAGDFPY